MSLSEALFRYQTIRWDGGQLGKEPIFLTSWGRIKARMNGEKRTPRRRYFKNSSLSLDLLFMAKVNIYSILTV